ncbi:MAG: glycosyltransferase N-terminal domain-containing protein [Planctomycetota bacterium]
MGILIDIAYLGLITALSPVLLYRMATREKYRAGFSQRFGNVPCRVGGRKCIWVHAVSVGEAKIAGLLVKNLEKEFPDWDIVVSTTTNTGQEIARKELPGRIIFYYPLDFSWTTRRALRRIRPSCLILIELELWPNLLRHAAKAGIPVIVMNGRITEKGAARCRWVRRIAPWVFSGESVRLFCVQNETYAGRLRDVGAPMDCIRTTGMMKYDAMNVEVGPQAQRRVRKMLGLGGEALVIVGASVYTDEIVSLAGIYREARRKFPNARLVLAPRHMEQLNEMRGGIERQGLKVVRRSTASEEQPADLQGGDAVVLVDTMGELVDICSVASCVFVGKSLFDSAAGGHNMLEPAGLGKAVLFGPHTSNFDEEARLLLEGGGAIRVADAEQLQNEVLGLLASAEKRNQLGANARQVVLQNMGATKRNIECFKEIVS